jgi:glycosyltransferase involved in cell wall biosynthesis
MMVLPHLGVGGAQRVATTLANHWANRGLDIHVVTTVDDKEQFYQLSPLIKRHVLNSTGVWSRIFTPTKVGLENRPISRPLGSDDTSATLPLPLASSQKTVRLRQIVLLALETGDLRLLWQVSLLIPRQALFGIVCYCVKRRVFGQGPTVYLNLLRASLWRVSALRKLLRRHEPDVVLSFLGATNITTIASAQGLSSRIVISERNDPGRQELDEPWQSLRPIVYPAADVITANSHGAIEHMQHYCASAKLGYVPNPVVELTRLNRPRSNTVLFLARLVPQKGPDILIDAFAKFVRENPDWSLQIAGDGPMDSELKSRVRSLEIEDRVFFHGRVKDPTDLLARASVFVLPSRFEGTPNSLLEAMAARLACIVTDASPGPLRLIQHGVSGLVVKTEDATELASALHQLAQDPEMRQKVGQAAWTRTRAFGLENVARDWERLLFHKS